MSTERGRDTVSLIARLARQLVLRVPVDGVSISLINSAGHDGTVFASDAVASRLDEVHFELGEGPGFAVWDQGAPELFADLDESATAAARWPAFVGEAIAAGVRGLWVFPLQLGAARVGVLTLHSLEPVHLSQGDIGHALRASDGAALVILGTLAGDDASGDGIFVTDGPDEFYRAEVYQASGIVMAQLDTDIGSAFARIQAYAYGNNLRVSAVAAEIVAHSLRLTDSFD